MQGLLQELNRRNVFRVAIAYLVASWVLLQVVDVVAPILDLPVWTDRLVFVILAVGLVPALILAWAFELTPDGLKRESDVSPEDSITDRTAQKLNYTIIAVLAVAVVFLLVDRQTAEEPAEALPAAAATEGAPVGASIAVLPFVNMSDDKDYFADGITEEILNALASVKDLKVAGRTSSFAFKGENDDLRRIGEALGVEHILEGSVRKSGDTVRITAQLIHVEDGFHLWSETYDRKLDDVFQVQDDISREILKQMSNTLLAGAAPVNTAQRTDPEAYELYLRAKQLIYARERESLDLAVEDLQAAIAIDPEYAPAYAQLGIAAILLSEEQYGDTPYDDAQRRGKRFIDIALDLDPNLAEAWAGLGLWEGRIGGDVDAAIEAYEKALAINPNLIDARNWLQIALQSIGEYRAAMEMTMEIADADPLYMPSFSNGLMMFAAFGREDLSIKWIERLKRFDPTNPRVKLGEAVNHIANGRGAEAYLLLEEERQKRPLPGVWRLMYTLSVWNTGQYELGADYGHNFWKPSFYSRLGRKDEAYALAREQAIAGIPGNLIDLSARDGRYKELTDFLEERWPTLQSFVDEHPGGEWGYNDLLFIALAYEEQNNERRFNESLRLLQEWEQNVLDQGVSNVGLTMNRALIRALEGDDDAAFTGATKAVEAGWGDSEGLAVGTVIMQRYVGDPRLAELEAMVLETINKGRERLGLPVFDSDYTIPQADAELTTIETT